MRNQRIFELLEVVRNKGNCIYTIQKAYDSMFKLKPLLEDKEYNELSIALSHFELGEGSEELNDVLKRLVDKYR